MARIAIEVQQNPCSLEHNEDKELFTLIFFFQFEDLILCEMNLNLHIF